MANEKRLIDANALAKDLELLAKHEDSFRQSVILGVVHTVKAQPTVDAVEVVHGYWRYYSTTMQECSNCQRHTARHKFKYCPHCGAKMKVGVEDG